MCGDHPCNCHQGLVLQEAASDPRRVVVYGPASVEMPSADDKLIRIDAVKQALPQLLRRRTLSVYHKDQVVGEIVQSITVDAAKSPNERSRRLVKSLGGELRTEVRAIRQEDVDAFPHLAPILGDEALFAASVLYDDNQTSRKAQEDVLSGALDSYSISGWITEAKSVPHCDHQGCRVLTEALALDLSAITLASRTGQRHGNFVATARNAGAALLVVQQAVRDPDSVCGQMWFHGTDAQRGGFGKGAEGRVRDEKAPKAWWDDCVSKVSQAVQAGDAAPLYALMEQVIRARGHEFSDFAACVEWAKRHNLNSPESFCGSLEKETSEAKQPPPVPSGTGQGQEGGKTIHESMPEQPPGQKPADLATHDKGAAPKPAAPQGGEFDAIKTMMMEMARRIETLEQRIGRLVPAPSQAAAQATPATEVMTAIAEAVKPVTAALDALDKRLGPIEQANAAPKVQTPTPANPGAGAKAKNPIRTVGEAADQGNPALFRTRFREAMTQLRPTHVPVPIPAKKEAA